MVVLKKGILYMLNFKDFNVDYFVELLNDEMWYPNAWKQQLEIAQESILKFYKEDVIKGLNEKLDGEQDGEQE